MANEMFWTTQATSGVVYEEFPWNISITDLLYCLIATVGLIGNGLVLYVFFRVPQLRVTTNILIRHQSLVDFISSLLLPLTFVIPEKNLGALNEQNPFLASVICKMWYSKYFFWTFIKISTINLVFLTLERYFAVLHSRQYRKRAGTRNLVLVCVFSWLLGATTVVYFPIINRVYEDGDCTSRSITPDKRKPIGYISLFTTLLIPTTVMVFVYVSIIRFLRRREATLSVYKERSSISKYQLTVVTTVENTPSSHHSPQPPSQSPSSQSSPSGTPPVNDGRTQNELHLQGHQNTCSPTEGRVAPEPSSKSVLKLEVPTRISPSKRDRVVGIAKSMRRKSRSSAEVASRNILITMSIVCVTYVVCWTPDILLYWHHSVVLLHDWSEPFHRFAILLSFINVCTNPIIYTLKYRCFQNGLKTVFMRHSGVVF